MLRFGCVLLLAALIQTDFQVASAQQPTGEQPVVIRRKMMRLTSPDTYRSAISLKASRQLTLTAAFEGRVDHTGVEQGQKVTPQTELVTIDSRRLELLHRKAVAAVKVAENELRAARISNDADRIRLGEARLALAQAELELVEFDKDKTSVRAPYEATILKVPVNAEEPVEKGSPLVTLGDLSSLECRIPVDRTTAEKGQPISLRVEDATVTGTVEAIDPVGDEQQHLRDLAVSVAMATVSVDNEAGRFAVGQAVFPELIPHDPVARVPLEAVQSGTGENRIVQVLRNHVVRNVPVRLHGQIGKDDVFVSGPFEKGDEVIVSSSVKLADSTAVRPRAAGTSGSTGATASPSGSSPARPAGKSNQPTRAGDAGF